jgi:predicted transcriptional regulator
MVHAVYKNRTTTYFKGTKTTREAAEKLFMNIKKKKEPVFIKEIHTNEELPVKDVNEDIKKESKWEPWDHQSNQTQKVAEKVVTNFIDSQSGETKSSEDVFDKIGSCQNESIMDFIKKSHEDLKFTQYDSNFNSTLPIKVDDVITNKMIWDASIETLKRFNMEEFICSEDMLLRVIDRLIDAKEYIEKYEKIYHLTSYNKIPSVNPANSIHPDYIICLEDGHKCKMLKTHLKKFGLTAKQYIKKWNLPDDYPMAAPNLSKIRKKNAEKHKIWQKNPNWKKLNK